MGCSGEKTSKKILAPNELKSPKNKMSFYFFLLRGLLIFFLFFFNPSLINGTKVLFEIRPLLLQHQEMAKGYF